MLKFKSIVLAFDQALYAKATEVKWRQSQRFKAKISCRGKQGSNHNADRAVFAQMMIIALPSSPLSPCSADGSLMKPNKASLAKKLQKKYDSS